MNREVGSHYTTWGYNSAGLLKTMWYPGDNQGNLGQQVKYAYLSQTSLDRAFDWTPPYNSTLTYVDDTQYDAGGRVTKRVLGEDGVQTQYSYYTWLRHEVL